MKVSGVVGYLELEGGVWVLRGDDGRTYELVGGKGDLRRNGKRVEVDGEIKQGAASFAMVGPILRVKSYRAR
jgi:hypothetical protein